MITRLFRPIQGMVHHPPMVKYNSRNPIIHALNMQAPNQTHKLRESAITSKIHQNIPKVYG
jgi:hypothetical protein